MHVHSYRHYHVHLLSPSFISSLHLSSWRHLLMTSSPYDALMTSSHHDVISLWRHLLMTSSPYDVISLWRHLRMTSSPYDVISLWHHLRMTSSPYDVISVWRTWSATSYMSFESSPYLPVKTSCIHQPRHKQIAKIVLPGYWGYEGISGRCHSRKISDIIVEGLVVGLLTS